MIFVAAKKGRTTNLFSPFSFVVVFGSGIRDLGLGIRDGQNSGSGINPHSQHWLREREDTKIILEND